MYVVFIENFPLLGNYGVLKMTGKMSEQMSRKDFWKRCSRKNFPEICFKKCPVKISENVPGKCQKYVAMIDRKWKKKERKKEERQKGDRGSERNENDYWSDDV